MHKFEKFDGALLIELKHMYDRSPNVFYANCKDELGLHRLSDLLRFTRNLDLLIMTQIPIVQQDSF